MARPFSSLIPSISNRLSAWQDIQDHLSKADDPKPRPTITISREFGCEGYVVADALKTLLEEASGEKWNVYDKTLLEAVAKEEGVDLEVLDKLGETARSFEKLGITPPEYHHHAEVFRALARRLVQFATVGNAIILGRGGAVLCQALPNCMHVRIEANLGWRVRSLGARMEMPIDEVRNFVLAHSSAREQFMREMLRVDPHDRTFFHLTFNNARSTSPAMAQAIVAYLHASWNDKTYFQAASPRGAL
jgi:cytidylate kinase